MKPTAMKKPLVIAMTFAAMLFAGAPVQATIYTNSATGNWSTSGNWTTSPGAPSVGGASDAVIVFNPTATANSTNDFAGFFWLNQMALQANFNVTNYAAGGIALLFTNTTGGTLPLLTNSGSSTLAINSAVTLATNLTIGAAGAITINSNITGSFGFTKTGTGTLTLGGGTGNIFSGTIAVNAGVLATAKGADIRNLTNTITVASGAALYIWGAFDSLTVTNPISLSGAGSGSYGALEIGGNESENGPITLAAAAKITHAYNSAAMTGPITSAGYNLEVDNTVSGQNGIVIGGSMSLGAGNLTVASVSGALPVYLNASNNFTGGTILTNYGSIQLGNINALGAGGLILYSNTLLNLNTNSISIATLSGQNSCAITDTKTLAGTTTLTVNQSVATTYSGTISNGPTRPLALTLSGAGALSLGGTNTYSGSTAVNAGELIGVTGGSCSNSTITVASGATNGVQLAAAGGQWVCTNLNYSSGTTYLDLNFGNFLPSAVTAPLLVNGSLAINGTLNVIIRNGRWSAGTYPLVSYTGTLSGAVPSSVFSLPSGLTAMIVNNNGSQRIDLSVTAAALGSSTTGVWTNLVSGNASGTWGTAANWLGGTIPNGIDAVAIFTTNSITVNSIITNETARTVGSLIFSNTTTGKYWDVDGSTNNQITLASSTAAMPSINVTNTQVFLGGFNGTQGFVKNGNGVLNIFGSTYTNIVSGPILVNAGALTTASGKAFRNIIGDITVAAGATFGAQANFDGTTLSNNIYLNGTGGTPSGYINSNITPPTSPAGDIYNASPTPWGALDIYANMTLGGTITLNTDSKITHAYNSATITGPIVATGAGKNLQLVTQVSGQANLVVSGSINLGNGVLTVAGTGTQGVTLNAANTYSGGTILNTGVLQLGNTGALGGGGLTVNGGYLDLNTNNISIPSLSGTNGAITDVKALAGTTTLAVNQSVATIYSGVISNGATRTLALTLSGTGVLALAGTNTYSGATAVNLGELIGVTGGSCSNSAITVASGATNGVQVLSIGGQWAGGNLTYSSGTTYLDVNFSNTAPSTATAPLLVNGNLILTGTTLNVIVRSTAGIGLGTYPLVKYTGTLSGTPPSTAFALPAGLTATINNNTGNKSLDLQVTAGNVLLWGVGNGTWDINSTANWKDPNGTAEKYSDSDTVTLDDTASGATPIAVTLNSTVSPATVTANLTNKNYTISGSGVIAGSASLMKNGGGTLTLSSSNSYSGGTTINGGQVTVGTNAAFGSGTVTVANVSGSVIRLNPNINLTNTIFINGGGTSGQGIIQPVSGTATNSGVVQINAVQSAGGHLAGGGGTLYQSGAITSSVPVTVRFGSVVLSGGGAYTNLSIAQDTTRLGANNGVSTNAVLSFGNANNSSGAFDLAGFNQTLAGITQTGTTNLNTITNSVSATPVTLTLAATNTVPLTNTYTGVIGGSLALTLNSGVTQIVTGTNTYYGNTTMSGGTLVVSNTRALQNSTLNYTNGTVQFGNNLTSYTLGGLAGTVNLGLTNAGGTAIALTVGGNGSNTSYSANLSQGGSLTKIGSGILTLSGANTYTGNTTISNGTLLVNGNSAAANGLWLVTNGATLGGNGTIGGNLVFASGTYLTNNQGSPLTNNGTLSLNGNTINVSTPSALTRGSYLLLTNTSGTGISGSFNTAPVISGSGLAANTTSNVVTTANAVYLAVNVTPTVTVNVGTYTYNGSAQGPNSATTSLTPDNGAVTWSYAGTANDSTSYGPNSAPPTKAGSYTATATVAADSANNLNAASSSATGFTISPATASVTADAKTKTYGAVNPGLTATVIGQVVGGDAINYSLNTDAIQYSAVGVSNIMVNLGSNPNYSLLTTNSTLTINPATTFVGASSSENPSGYKDTVTYTATLPADATGSVVFSSTNGAFSTNAISSGSATSLSITNLSRGTNVITVAYLGDGNYLGSTTNIDQIVTNHPPVATDASYYRAKGLTLKIAVTNLLTYASDSDGDTNILQSVGSGTTGATIWNDSNYVYYVPSTGAGSNDNDTVSYAVSDGLGGTATANILVNVYSATGLAQMSLPTNGVVNIKFFGIPNYTYVVQTTTNLSVPWWTLGTNTASTNGTWLFTDPNATNAEQYYRSAQP